MAMLSDILSRLLGGEKSLTAEDQNVVTPNMLMDSQKFNADPRNITNDKGDLVGYDTNDWSKNNPFVKAIATSRANNNSGPSVLRQLLSSILGGGLQPGTGTVGGGGTADHVPGTRQDAALTPAPIKQQKQPNLAPSQPQSQLQPPPDYSMPKALDPVSIEEFRTSLLSQAGQLDPTNPNGLAGRMSSPNAKVDQRNQMNDAQRQHDSLRGFDGSRTQRIKDVNGRQ